MPKFALFLTLFAAVVQSSPTPDVIEQSYAKGKLPEELCKKVHVVVKALKAHKAISFCSSYLSIPAVTSTSAVTATSVITVEVTATTTAPTSVTTTTSVVTVPGTTSYVFQPGNSPAPGTHRRDRLIPERKEQPEKPDYLNVFGNDIISAGCGCLDIPIKTIVVSETATATSTATITETIASTPLATSTTTSTETSSDRIITLYPCATPLPTLISTLPYGDAVSSNDLGIQNTRFDLNDARGASAEACCNTCYFGIPNCIQAFFYSYQGCVVQQAFNQGSGVGVSVSCPSGLFSGLTYTLDTSPAFRSTGDFAGPCGVQYNNF
ncbi:hypothetical protein C7974DRAFT_94827 [Boeremia exigua]|uniref:uncharacterized protein n=1 Tax=Boeremia exigua TaxID=749465 RepID=UPI001E8E1B52|nr:uncharacterized protein C7974DRAFT_94827 [Boeremia exigua]KAH6642081.1 hypothetical protein C7974DRAFT_94827 [Boeremia exigua]